MPVFPTSFFISHLNSSNSDNNLIIIGNLTECHGSINFLQCLGNDRKCPQYGEYWDVDSECISKLTVDPSNDHVIGTLPTCPGCGGVARPTVLMFGKKNSHLN